MTRIRTLNGVALAGCLLVLEGCMSFQPVNYRPRYGNYSLLQAQALCVAAVGAATMAPNAPASLGMRGSPLTPPPGETFASMIAAALEEELGQAGLHDPRALTLIDVTLLDNRLDAGAGTGDALLSAQFTTRHGSDNRVLFTAPVKARREWTSSFIGVTAVEQGRTQYSLLIGDLLHQLFLAPDFIASLSCEPQVAKRSDDGR